MTQLQYAIRLVPRSTPPGSADVPGQPGQTRRLAYGPLATSLLSLVTSLRFEHRSSQLGCDPHVRLFEQSQVLFEVPRGEAEAVQPEQDAQSARDLQPRPTSAKAGLPVVEHDRARELQPERDNFRLTSADRWRLLPHPLYALRIRDAVGHPVQRYHPATGRAWTLGKLLRDGFRQHDPVKLPEERYVAEEVEKGQRARVEDGLFFGRAWSLQGDVRLLWFLRVTEFFGQVLFGEVRVVETVRGVPADRRDPIETE